MRLLFGTLVLLSVLPSATALLSAASDPTVPCIQHLTFRWTSGNPISLDITHPSEASLKNPPFLIDPEILSVTVGRDWAGPNVTITLGATPAAILAAESSIHVGQQMLIMLGDTVISAAIVREAVRNVMVLNGPNNDGQLSRLANALRDGPNAAGPCTISER